MKICVINPGLQHGRIRTEALAKYFAEVHLIEFPPVNDCVASSVPNLNIHTDLVGELAWRGFRLKRLIKQIEPDGIVCHFASNYPYFDQIFWGRYPVAVVAMGHDILHEWSTSSVSSIYSNLVKSALARTDYICAKSDVIHEKISEWGTRGVLQTNYWGIDREKFQPCDKMTARKRLGLPLEGELILSPRKIIRRCNIDVIVEGYAKVAKKFPGSRLLLLGGADEFYLSRIKQRLDILGINKQIHLIGSVPQSDIPDYYHASDVVVSLASSEGFPTTVFEAQACGRPVIAGIIPQIEELLINFENALLTEIDSDSVAEAISSLLRSPKLVSRIVTGGKKMVAAHGDLDKNAQDFATQFKAVVANWSGTETGLGQMKFKLCYLPFFLRNQFMKTDR